MRYKSPAALEMAVKNAAMSSPMGIGRAVSAFYFHRLLCRVFAGGNDAFVLKGGQAMLARTVDARTTRDIDLLSRQVDVDAALEELIGFAGSDLGDYITFEFDGSRPIKLEDEYRSGVTAKFVPILGTKRMQAIAIDLVIDEVPLEKAELVTPADRIEVDGIETCDYLVYPVEDAVSDKLCALVEMHEGRASSRVKDLVDIAVYATTCVVDGSSLQSLVHREAAVRGVGLPERFAVPEQWGEPQEKQFEKLCTQTGLPSSLRTLESAAELAGVLFDPAINGQTDGMVWDPSKREWDDTKHISSDNADEHAGAFTVRPIREDEIGLLWDFLYEAIYISEGFEGEVPRSIVHDDPMCRAAVEGFGTRVDDRALVAEAAGEVVGACWVRTTEEYGHIDDETPSFSISVVEPYRGRGIGTALMRRMLEELKDGGYARASLSVQKENPALRLYERLGFRVVGDGADESEWLMVRDL